MCVRVLSWLCARLGRGSRHVMAGGRIPCTMRAWWEMNGSRCGRVMCTLRRAAPAHKLQSMPALPGGAMCWVTEHARPRGLQELLAQRLITPAQQNLWALICTGAALPELDPRKRSWLRAPTPLRRPSTKELARPAEGTETPPQKLFLDVFVQCLWGFLGR